MASTTPANSSSDLPQPNDPPPSTLTILVTITVLGLVWFVVIVSLGLVLAAVLRWILTN